ncbi:hypothetical protein ACFL4T_02490 [candidate division KSB1 bacterium]
MKFLTRQEEMVLLSVFQLKGNSYLVKIREHLIQITGKEWSISSVYVPLEKLRKEGYLDTYIGAPEPKKGGKAIKYYKLTKTAVGALEEVRSILDTMWDNADGLAVEG